MDVLLAEDDEALRDTFGRQLTFFGHDVRSFANGRELADAIEAGAQADLVWSDLEMPVADGFEVLRVARVFLPRVPVLIVSGHTEPGHLMRALQEGATFFLPKPYEPSELQSVLRRVESLRQADRNEERAWLSLRRSTTELEIPPDINLVPAIAALLRNHARAALDASECHGLHIAAHEILLNAIEHGCLEITREEKAEALTRRRYAELVAARAADPRLASRVVAVRLEVSAAEGVVVEVSDPGQGFDATALPDPSDAENLFLPSGRGIILASLHVDELTFTDHGRTARLVVRRG
jgi:CheY-like chemotaxis protein